MVSAKKGLIRMGCAMLLLLAAFARADDSAVIKGKILFKGNPDDFKRSVVDTTKDPNCAKGVAKIGSEQVVINTKTTPVTLRNVMVYVIDGLGDRKFTAPSTPVILDQKGCQYAPHVLAKMEGQELIVRNSDETNHNIHFMPQVNEVFNKTQPKPMDDKVKLVAEEPFLVKCDVHPWMGAHIGVFKHPFFAVTGEEGTFELKGLPAGKYKIKAWHEKFGEQTAEVEVATGAAKEQDFTFEGKK